MVYKVLYNIIIRTVVLTELVDICTGNLPFSRSSWITEININALRGKKKNNIIPKTHKNIMTYLSDMSSRSSESLWHLKRTDKLCLPLRVFAFPLGLKTCSNREMAPGLRPSAPGCSHATGWSATVGGNT